MPDLPISTISFAYPEASLEDRATVAAAVGDLDLARNRIAAAGHEVFIMGTCLRLDLMVPGPSSHLDQIAELLIGNVSVHGQRRTGSDALKYLFRVAAGLESPLKGEDDVLVQFRQALDRAKATGALHSPLVVKSLEGAIAAGRKARATMTGAGHRTLARVAAERVRGAGSIAIFGAGTMGRAVADAARGTDVTVVVRRPHQVEIEGTRVVGMEKGPELLATVDAAIVATAARGKLLDDTDFAAALAKRTSALTLIDLAVPRNLLPPPGFDVMYADIDDLSRLVEDHEDISRAAVLVEAASAEAANRMATHESVGPVIAMLLEQGERAAAEVAERFTGRFEPGQRDLAAQMARAVARKILHEPVAYLRQSRRSPEELGVVAEAFDVAD